MTAHPPEGQTKENTGKEAERAVSEERDQRLSQKPRWLSPKGRRHRPPLDSLSEANREGLAGEAEGSEGKPGAGMGWW